MGGIELRKQQRLGTKAPAEFDTRRNLANWAGASATSHGGEVFLLIIRGSRYAVPPLKFIDSA